MLQNFRVTAFTVSESLRENQQGGVPPTTQIRVNIIKKLTLAKTSPKNVFLNLFHGAHFH